MGMGKLEAALADIETITTQGGLVGTDAFGAEDDQMNQQMGVEPKIMVPPNHPLKNRVFHYFHHPFWGFPPIFGSTPKSIFCCFF